MTRGIALLMVSSAAWALGHLLRGPSLYLRPTLMRTFRSPSPGFLVVMTCWQSGQELPRRAPFWEEQGLVIDAGAPRGGK